MLEHGFHQTFGQPSATREATEARIVAAVHGFVLGP